VIVKWRQWGGDHGGWYPLRNVLQRTHRIWDYLKWMALICDMMLSKCSLVGWHDCSGEGRAWARLEEHSEQILEVVASQQCTCGDGFILWIEGSDTILRKGRSLNINSNLPYVATRAWPHRESRSVNLLRARVLWKVIWRRSIRWALKKQGSCRTEPHQDSGVRSPKYKKKVGKGNRQNGWKTSGKLLALAR